MFPCKWYMFDIQHAAELQRTSLLRIIAEDTHYQNITRSKLYAHFQCASTLVFQPRARWLHLLKDRRRPDISEPCEVVVPTASRGGHRRVQHGRLRPALVEVGNACQPSYVRPEAWLDLPGLQLPPVDWFEPLVVLYLVAASRRCPADCWAPCAAARK